MLHLLFNTPSAFRVSSWLSQLGETAFGPSKMTPKNKRLRPFLSRQGLPLAGRQLSVIFSYYVHSKKGSGRSLVKSKEVLTCSVWAVVRVIRPCFWGVPKTYYMCLLRLTSPKPQPVQFWCLLLSYPDSCSIWEVWWGMHVWSFLNNLLLPAAPRGPSAPNWFNVWVNIKKTCEWM